MPLTRDLCRSLLDCFADKGYDAERHRDLCRRFGAKPRIHKRGQPRGSGLGKRRWPVERSNAWTARARRLARDYERLPEVLAGLHFLVFVVIMLARVLPNMQSA